MKKILTICALALITCAGNLNIAKAQNVGINEDGGAPHASAMLDVESNSKGILIPRINYNNRPNNPATGLLIYVTSNGPLGNNTFYYYNGTDWLVFDQWAVSGSNIYYDSGSVTVGNADAVDPDVAKMKVHGGIAFSGLNQSTTKGMLFYNPTAGANNAGAFQYINQSNQVQTIGTGTIETNGNPGYETDDYYRTDDLIVTESMAIGKNAEYDYNFQFNTLVLQDEIIRLLFDDTSNSSSFPNNDWMLEINSATPGGKNYFAIKDVTANKYPFMIEAPGVDNAFYVKSDNIGLGTNNPEKQLHLVNGTTPTIRFEQDGSQANTPQTWDIQGDAEKLSFVDITNSGTEALVIEQGAPTASLHVDENGNTGFGTATPARSVHISTAMKLEPQNAAPANPSKGDLYFDNNDNKLKCYDGTQWQNCW